MWIICALKWLNLPAAFSLVHPFVDRKSCRTFKLILYKLNYVCSSRLYVFTVKLLSTKHERQHLTVNKLYEREKDDIQTCYILFRTRQIYWSADSGLKQLYSIWIGAHICYSYEQTFFIGGILCTCDYFSYFKLYYLFFSNSYV